MIKIELDVRTAAAVRQVLFYEQERYSLDPVTCPPRIQDIRGIIIELDKQIEEELKNEVSELH